jgi:hypothetical protein
MKPKTIHHKVPTIPVPIAAAHIDPVTNRFCATQAEICKALDIHPYQVRKCNPRRYRKKYLDVLDVMDARDRTPLPGRPKKFQRK